MASKKKIKTQQNYANRDKTYSRNSTIHMIRRFQQHHGINISLLDLDRIYEQIDNGTADFIRTKENGSKLYKVKCRDKDIVVVISGKGKNRRIKTTYPVNKDHLYFIEENKKRRLPEKTSVNVYDEKYEDYRADKLRHKIAFVILSIYVVIFLIIISVIWN